jgi:GTP cyclohydrolase IA
MTIDYDFSKNEDIDKNNNLIIKNKSEIEEQVKNILSLIGEDPAREGLIKTPHRVSKMFSEVLEGYFLDPIEVVNGAIYQNEYNSQDMVIVTNIDYKSMCEHHMLPFTGKAHVAYIPDKKIIGLSKIPRLINVFSKRLQVQERLNQQIVDIINEIVEPKGVIALLEGKHSCASFRGVEQEDLKMKTVCSKGIFVDKIELKQEFLDLLKNN